MTTEEQMINALKGIVPYPQLRRAVKVSVDAIRAAQAEQRRKDAEMAKGMTGARPREIADAILAQEV